MVSHPNIARQRSALNVSPVKLTLGLAGKRTPYTNGRGEDHPVTRNAA